jgi:CRP-like cAMP-binding protein
MTAQMSEIPVFQDLSPEQVEELSGWMKRMEFGEGVEIFPEGSQPLGMYVLVRGTVAVEARGESGTVRVAELEGPSVFGEMGFLTGEKHSAAIRATSRVIAGLLPLETFQQRLFEDNVTALRLAYNIGRIACQRLRATTHRLLLLSDSGRDAATRGVSRHLKRICHGILEKEQDQ